MRYALAIVLVLIGATVMGQSPIDSLQPFDVPLNGKPVSAIVVVARQPVDATVLIVPDASGKLVVYTITPLGLTPPTPPTPAVLTGLAKDVHDWSLALVPAANRASSRQLAAAYRATAAKIRAGELKTLADVQAAQTTANRTALGLTAETANSSPWKPLIVKVAGYLVGVGHVDPAAPATPLATVWDEIATGLEAVQ